MSAAIPILSPAVARGRLAALDPIRGMRTILGTMCDPHTGWLLMRSLETLKLIISASSDGARQVAEFLSAIRGSPPSGIWAFCPSIILIARSSNASARARAQRSVSRSRRRGRSLRRVGPSEVIKLAVSLGGTETLASHPAAMTHSDIPPEEQMRLGITPALIRLSVGVENPDDLIADLDQALRR